MHAASVAINRVRISWKVLRKWEINTIWLVWSAALNMLGCQFMSGLEADKHVWKSLLLCLLSHLPSLFASPFCFIFPPLLCPPPPLTPSSLPCLSTEVLRPRWAAALPVLPVHHQHSDRGRPQSSPPAQDWKQWTYRYAFSWTSQDVITADTDKHKCICAWTSFR